VPSNQSRGRRYSLRDECTTTLPPAATSGQVSGLRGKLIFPCSRAREAKSQHIQPSRSQLQRDDGHVKLFRRERASKGSPPEWRPIPAWSWMLGAIIAVALTALVITTWLLAIAGHANPGTDQANAKLDAVRTGLTAGAGAGAAVGLMLAFRRQHHQEITTALNDHDATERRITELYTKAVEQLGSDKAPVRLGGLYALERLAQDNRTQRQTIVNVICAYLRMPFPTAAPNQDRDG
jgi:hypothetical protein